MALTLTWWRENPPRSDWMCTLLLHKHHFTRQELLHFLSPPSDIVNSFVVQMKKNSNNPSCERRRGNQLNLQVYKLVLNATSCQTHATLRLTPKPVKKKIKKTWGSSLNTEPTSTRSCTASQQINIIKSKASSKTEWRTQWHIIVQYVAYSPPPSFFFHNTEKTHTHSTFVNETYNT